LKTDPPQQFYDDLAPLYHLIYSDWEFSIDRQANELDSIIREIWGDKTRDVLDAACGIGTQSIGLTKLGYRVVSSDVSEAAIARAKVEAEARGLLLLFSVVDMREAHVRHARSFDLVLACDNAVPHLLTDEEILQTFNQFFQCTRPGGGCLISVRDYEHEDLTRSRTIPYGTRREDNTTWVINQVWEPKGSTYETTFYFTKDDGTCPRQTYAFRTTYYAVGISKLMTLMREAGYTDIRRLDGRFFQPVIAGTRKD